MKPFAGVVQAFQQAPDEPPLHRIAGFRPALLKVAGVLLNDVAAFFGVVDLIEFRQQLLAVGDQEFPLARQLFEFFLDQIDNVRVRGHLIHEPHRRFDLAIDADHLLLHTVPLGQEVRVLGSGILTEIVFDVIQMASAEKNLGQVIHHRFLHFFGAEAFHFALDGIADHHFVAVVTVWPMLAVRGLAD